MPIPMNMNTEEQRQLNWWHFTNNTKPDYKDTLEGTLIEIDIVQRRSWNDTTKRSVPEFWPDGNPKRGYRWIILDAATGVPTAFEFGDSKNDSFKRGLAQSLPGLTDMESLGGHYLRIHTPDGVYNLQHPRPFVVEDLGLSNVPYEGTKDMLSNVQPKGAQNFQSVPQYQQSQYQQQPVQQGVPAQGVMPGGYPVPQQSQVQGNIPAQQGYGNQVPMQQIPVQAQQVPVQNQTLAQQAVQQRPAQQQPAPVQSVQGAVPQMPQHQDMASQVQQPATPYDESIPF